MTNNKLFDVSRDGFQCLTIPRSGRYRFEVIGASWFEKEPGARIIGEVSLTKGEKITVALGQKGNENCCGNGGSFVLKESGTSDPQPLFVAGGAGYACSSTDYNFSKASLSQTSSSNDKIGSSGVQQFIGNDPKNIFCGGAGFLEEPVTGELRKDSVAPKSYKDGLVGGKGTNSGGDLLEGGFGGGGAYYYKNGHEYWGAGGGYTGGGTKINGGSCDGGGGASFSVDKGAQFDHVQEIYGKCSVTYLD